MISKKIKFVRYGEQSNGKQSYANNLLGIRSYILDIIGTNTF